jgi:hypothetical protein
MFDGFCALLLLLLPAAPLLAVPTVTTDGCICI